MIHRPEIKSLCMILAFFQKQTITASWRRLTWLSWLSCSHLASSGSNVIFHESCDAGLVSGECAQALGHLKANCGQPQGDWSHPVKTNFDFKVTYRHFDCTSASSAEAHSKVSRCHELKKVDGHLKLPQVIASSPVFHQAQGDTSSWKSQQPIPVRQISYSSTTLVMHSWKTTWDARGTQCTGRSLNPAPAKNWGTVGSEVVKAKLSPQVFHPSSCLTSPELRLRTCFILATGNQSLDDPNTKQGGNIYLGPRKNTKNEARHHAANAKWGCEVRMTNPSNIRQAQVHASLASSFVNSKSSSSISLTQPKVDTVQGWRLQYSSRLQLQPETETWAP